MSGIPGMFLMLASASGLPPPAGAIDASAAIAPIAPASGGLTPDNYSLAPAKDLPVIIVMGDADTAVPVARTRQWVEKVKEQKMTHEYHEILGGTHGSVIATGMPDIFAFFARHTKGR